MRVDELRVRSLAAADLAALAGFRCSTGSPWEDVVEAQVRGPLLALAPDSEVSLGAFVLLTIFRQMRELGRHPRTFARIDRRNRRSLALCDRVGLSEERPDPSDDNLVQRWGELPS